MEDIEKLRYPIGKFTAPETFTSNYIKDNIAAIASFPERLKEAVLGLNESQLDTPYRTSGWTVRQVVHHCADSHMNCYIRLKWTLTEDNPTIKFYYEDRWSELHDNRTMPIAPTLALLEGLHYRIVYLLKNLSAAELEKTFVHPEHGKQYSISEIIGLYSWHGNHHLAHIKALAQREGW